MKEYSSKFFTAIYDTDKDALIQTWKNVIISEKEFKKEMLEYAKIIEENNAKYYLVNLSVFEFAIDPKFHAWLNINISTKILAKNSPKLAFVISKDIFTNVSIKQVLNEDEGSKIEQGFFGNIKDAENWLYR